MKTSTRSRTRQYSAETATTSKNGLPPTMFQFMPEPSLTLSAYEPGPLKGPMTNKVVENYERKRATANEKMEAKKMKIETAEKQPTPLLASYPTSTQIPPISQLLHIEKVDDQPDLIEMSSSTKKMEVPSDLRLFRILLGYNGKTLTFLIPMPEGSSVEDVRNSLPAQFIEMASDYVRKEEEEKLQKANEEKARIAQEFAAKIYEGEDEQEREDENGAFFVNPKQFDRILKRRKTRQRLVDSGRMPTSRQKYLHESRHRHALTRIRLGDGRFGQKQDLDDENIQNEESEGSMYRDVDNVTNTYVDIRPAPIPTGSNNLIAPKKSEM